MESFQKIAIVGLGLIGGSLGIALKRKVPEVTVYGVDDQTVLDEALEAESIDKGFTKNKLKNCLRQSDLIFLCTPITDIIHMIPELIPCLKPGTLVTDVGSTKKEIVKTAEDHFTSDRYFIGGHPMTGGEGRGIQWADPLLFENAVYVLTPSNHLPRMLIQNFGQLIEQIGSKVLFLTPAMHDKIAAAVSHLPQLVAVTLVNMVAKHQTDSSHFLKLAAGGFRDMTRVASSPYEIWEDIIHTNHEEMILFLDECIECLHETRKNLEQKSLAKVFRQAARNRLSIPSDTKGFLLPNFDLSVRVEDKPGEIADIADVLSKNRINIKDIEVLKVREGDAGVIRLAFETEDMRQTAKSLLNGIGYYTRLRK